MDQCLSILSLEAGNETVHLFREWLERVHDVGGALVGEFVDVVSFATRLDVVVLLRVTHCE